MSKQTRVGCSWDMIVSGNKIKNHTSNRFYRHVNTLVMAFLLIFSQSGICGTYGGGAGTAADPFVIATAEHMQDVGSNEDDWDKHFIMTADINLEDYTGEPLNTIRTFTGVFDGGGYAIINMTLEVTGGFESQPGLFGNLGWQGHGEVKNLGLVNVDVAAVGGFDGLGSLAGMNNGRITNCYVTGSVSSHSGGVIGGLVGISYGDVTNCYATCNISIGMGGSIGGLVGWNRGVLANSYAAGNCEGTFQGSVGGLVSTNSGAIENCFSAGNVIGNVFVGGLAGRNENGSMTNCYTICKVLGTSNVGGISGLHESGTYYSCFWNSEVNPSLGGVGNISGPAGVLGKTTLGMQRLGTFTGYGWDFVGESVNGTDDFWKMPGCGYPLLSWQRSMVVPDVSGLTEEEALSEISSTGAFAVTQTGHSESVEEGYVISQEPAAGCEATIVTIIVSDGYPYEAGNGTEAEPYQIWTAEQLNVIGTYPGDFDKHFVLMKDIDLSGYTGTSFNIIGPNPNGFTGVFDGRGHTVSNFSYAASPHHYCGLFGSVGTGGKIMNLGVTDVVIDAGEGQRTGGLAGSNSGSITNCYATGSVTGGTYVGGLVGLLIHGSIKNCYAKCSVSGVHQVGGLAGDLFDGTVTNSYAEGSASGDNSVGGITGLATQESTISNCFAAVAVSAIENEEVGGFLGAYYLSGNFFNNFWDSDLNAGLTGVGNKADPTGVTSKTTAEMRVQSTFTDRWWDFAGEEVNGSDDVWRMCVDGVSYPRLAWEFYRCGDFICPDGVAYEDLGYFLERWLSVENNADLNYDGYVNMFDFAIFAQHWMKGI
ncbi:MAG: PASTA domain-containing protein [Anaerohalosphaera sp.]|nr:PASTA domain-containing protein [Anaerohalosphaera sp.]